MRRVTETHTHTRANTHNWQTDTHLGAHLYPPVCLDLLFYFQFELELFHCSFWPRFVRSYWITEGQIGSMMVSFLLLSSLLLHAESF